MSGPQDHDVTRLARELADTPGAVPVLVTLLERESADCETIAAESDTRIVEAAIRWLTAVNLVRRASGSGTFDLHQSGVRYELTTIGTALTRSLVDLTAALAEPPSTPQRELRIAES